MSAPLPGLGGEPYRRIENQEYQDLAAKVHEGVLRLLGLMAAVQSKAEGSAHIDGGPIIQGALAAIVQFAVDSGDITDDVLREELQRGIDTALPQFRMSRAAKGLQGGHA